MKVKFFLNTTPEFFASWLLHRTSEDRIQGKLDFLTEEGRIVLHPSEWRPPISNVVKIQMFGSRIMPASGDTQRIEGVPHMISFVAVGLAYDRVEVIAECKEPAVMDYFEELTSRIAKTFPRPAEEGLETTPKHFPKRPRTLKKYKRAYDIILQTRKRFHDCWKKGDFDNPTPKAQDHKDALAYHMGWKPCDKTLRRIIEFGDKRLLG